MTVDSTAERITRTDAEQRPSNAAALLLGMMAVYFVAHVITRTLVSGNLQLDEAEQLVVTQQWQWGYGSQPPLYAWIQKGLFAALGPGVFALSILKNLLLWSTYCFVYLAAWEILNEKRLAVLGAAGLLFIPQFAWESQRDQTHLALATMCAAATLWIFTRLLKTRSRGWYVAFGLVTALGILSKYNYALLPAGLLVAALSMARFRGAILNPKLFLSLVVCSAVIWPHVQWVITHAALAASESNKFQMATHGAGLHPHLVGLWQITKALVGFVVAPLLVFAPFLDARWKKGSATDGLDELGQLLGRVFVAGLLMATAAIVIFGVTYVRDRWLQPLLFALPILLIAWTRSELTPRFHRRLLTFAAFVAITVLAAVNGTVIGANTLRRPHNLNVPHGALAAELRRRGFENGVIIAQNYFVGGNMKMHFPHNRVIVPENGRAVKIEPGSNMVVVWRDLGIESPEALFDFAAAVSGVSRVRIAPQFLEVPCANGPRRSERFGFAILP